MLLKKSNLAWGAATIAILSAPGAAWAETTPAPVAVQVAISPPGETGAAETGSNLIIVTGARIAGRTVENSPTPIDVLPLEALRDANQTSLLQTLNDTLPSFNVPNMPGYGINTFIRAGQLRGLSSGHVLVLVNGKRRHTTARLGVNDAGAASVDLGLIPVSTIERVEVLRDGAAAIYGSDAIAGVINVITRKTPGTGELRARVGEYFQGGGLAQQYNAGVGIGLGEGHLYLSGEYSKQKQLFGEDEVPSNILFYFPLDSNGNPVVPGGSTSTGPTLPAGATPDPREATVDRKQIFGASGGVPEAEVVSFTADLGIPVGDAVELYGFADYSYREGTSPQHFRFPSRDQVVRALWPDGFTPYSGVKQTNFSALLGLRGDFGDGWSWDLSSGYGEDELDAYNYDTNSPSYGLASKTDFYLGTYRYSAWTSNLDIRKSSENGLFGIPTDISFGGEFRRETYQRTPGEEQSWSHGGALILDGPNAGKPVSISDSGTQADTGTKPIDAQDDARNAYALYAGLTLTPSDAFTLDLAGRYENIDNAGDIVTGRVSARYAFSPAIAIRGTVSTGFQAPALAAQTYRQTEVTVSNTIHTLSVSSPEAQALGATLLRPERSLNFSAGLVIKPTRNTNLTVDVYQVRVKDRISSIEQFGEETHPGSGVLVEAASPTFGPLDRITYLINAGTTRTRGVDVVLDGQHETGVGDIRWSLAGNYNDTVFLDVADTPDVLSAFNISLVSAAAQATTRYRSPVFKGIGSLHWSSGPFSAGVRGTYYGTIKRRYTLRQPSGPNTTELVDVGNVFVADLEVGYDFTEKLGISFNANNVLSTKPKQVPDNATSRWPFLTTAYVQDSPVNPLGGFYSATLTYRW